MDKKMTLLDYISQIFMFFGITIAILNVFCFIFGESASEISTIFALGNKGVSVATTAQFLLAVALIVALRLLLMSDRIFKKMPLTLRIILMFAGVLAITLVFNVIFGWFPTDDPMAWTLFIICFAVSCCISTVISTIKQKQENRRLKEALEKVKGELV